MTMIVPGPEKRLPCFRVSVATLVGTVIDVIYTFTAPAYFGRTIDHVSFKKV